MIVDAIEDFACRLHRQRRDDRAFAVRGDSEDARGNTKADVIETTQLLDCGVYLAGISSLRVENGFGVIEENDRFLRG